MSTIKKVMEELHKIRQTPTQTPILTQTSTLPKEAATPMTQVTFKLEFLKANHTSTGPIIEFSLEPPFRDGKGALTKPFKKACTAAVHVKLRGQQGCSLIDAKSVHIYGAHEGQFQEMTAPISDFLPSLMRNAPDNKKGALRMQIIKVFGTTPPWDPTKTWDNALQNNPDQRKAPTPK